MKKYLLILFCFIAFFSCDNTLYNIPFYQNIALDGVVVEPMVGLVGEDFNFSVDALAFDSTVSLSGVIKDANDNIIHTFDPVENITRPITLLKRLTFENPGVYSITWTINDGETTKNQTLNFSVILQGAPIPSIHFIEGISNLKIADTVQVDPRESVLGASIENATLTDIEWEVEYVNEDGNWVAPLLAEDGRKIVFPEAAYDLEVSNYFSIVLPRFVGSYRLKVTMTNNYEYSTVGYSEVLNLGYKPLPPDESVMLFSGNSFIGPFGSQSLMAESSTRYATTLLEVTNFGDLITKINTPSGESAIFDPNFLGSVLIIEYKVGSLNAGVQPIFSVSNGDDHYFMIYQNANMLGVSMQSGEESFIKQEPVAGFSVGDVSVIVVTYELESNTYTVFGGFGSFTFTGTTNNFLIDSDEFTLAAVGSAETQAGLHTLNTLAEVQKIELYNSVVTDDINAWAESNTEVKVVDQTPIYNNPEFIADFKMFQPGDETGSQYFRIPALLTLKDQEGNLTDKVLAFADIRYSGNSDSPANIEIGMRTSEDAGASFGPAKLIPSLTFDDRPRLSGTSSSSASFIDACVVQNHETGRIFVMPDLFTWGGGLMGGNVGVGSGFMEKNGKKVMRLTPTAAVTSGTAPTTDTPYSVEASSTNATVPGNFWVEDTDVYPQYDTTVDGAIRYHSNGYPILLEPCKRKIYDDTDSYTGYFLNERFEVCYDGSDHDDTSDDVILQVNQIGGSQAVPMNIAYMRSIFQMFRTSYNFMVYSDDEGVTWSDGIFLNGQLRKPESHISYLIVGPGTGLYVDKGPHKGRVMMTLYANKHENGAINNEIACAMWSDDNGITWERGNFPNGHGDAGKTSESVLVLMPDNSIRMFCRSASQRVASMHSTDGGVNWSNPIKIDQIGNGSSSGCMLTVFNYPQQIEGLPALILASPQRSGSRADGTMWVGLIQDGSGSNIEWKYNKLIISGDYQYSSATPLNSQTDGMYDIALFAEGTSLVMSYVSFPLNYLLTN